MEHVPAANTGEDTYTLMKFFDVSDDLVRATLSGMDDGAVDFPYVCMHSHTVMHSTPSCCTHTVMLHARRGGA